MIIESSMGLYIDFISKIIKILFETPEVESQKKLNNKRDKFFYTLKEGLKLGTITTMEDLVNIYKGIIGLSSEDLSYRYGLSRILRDFLVILTSKNEEIFGNSIDDDIIRDWKEKVTEFIKQNDTTAPFADLPANERNILNDILIFLENGDTESVKRKNLELARIIQVRSDNYKTIRNDYERINKINTWTVPVSFFGLIFTIIFGILAYIK